jgi:hypothetical protein
MLTMMKEIATDPQTKNKLWLRVCKKTQRQGFLSFRKKWVAKTRRKTSDISHYSRPPDGDRVKPVTRAKIPVTKKGYLPTYLPLSRAPVSRPAGTGGQWKSREICSVEETYFYGQMGFEAGGHLSDSVALRRRYSSVDF